MNKENYYTTADLNFDGTPKVKKEVQRHLVSSTSTAQEKWVYVTVVFKTFGKPRKTDYFEFFCLPEPTSFIDRFFRYVLSKRSVQPKIIGMGTKEPKF